MKRWIVGLALCAAASAQVKLPPYSRDVLPNGTAVRIRAA